MSLGGFGDGVKGGEVHRELRVEEEPEVFKLVDLANEERAGV